MFREFLHFVWIVSLVLELTWPAWLMAVRWRWPKLMPFWMMVLAIIFGGWFLANAQVCTRLAYLDDIVQQMGNNADPTDPIVKEWEADGAPMVFAAFFGLLYGPVIAVLWSPLLVLIEVIRRWQLRRLEAQAFEAGPTGAAPQA